MVAKVKANKRKPEQATPWTELKEAANVLASNEKQAKAKATVPTPNKKVLDDRQKNYEKFLSEDIKNNSTFDTLKDKNPKKGAPIVAKKQQSSSSEDSSDEEEEQVVVKQTQKQPPAKVNGKANGKVAIKADESSSSEEDSDSDDDDAAPPPAKVAKPTPTKQNGKAPVQAVEESSSEDDSDDSDEEEASPPAATKGNYLSEYK